MSSSTNVANIYNYLAPPAIHGATPKTSPYYCYAPNIPRELCVAPTDTNDPLTAIFVYGAMWVSLCDTFFRASKVSSESAEKSAAIALATKDTASATLASSYATTAHDQFIVASSIGMSAHIWYNKMILNRYINENFAITALQQTYYLQAMARDANIAGDAATAAAAGAKAAENTATAFMKEYNALASIVVPSSGPSTSIQNMSAFYYFSLFPFRYVSYPTFSQPIYISKFLVDTILNNGYKKQLYGYNDLELFILMYGFAYVVMADKQLALTSDAMRSILLPVYQLLWNYSSTDVAFQFAMTCYFAQAASPPAVNTTKTGRAAIAQMYGKLCLALYN